MEELCKLAANYGFPMVVAGYLLMRLEPTIQGTAEKYNLADYCGSQAERAG